MLDPAETATIPSDQIAKRITNLNALIGYWQRDAMKPDSDPGLKGVIRQFQARVEALQAELKSRPVLKGAGQ